MCLNCFHKCDLENYTYHQVLIPVLATQGVPHVDHRVAPSLVFYVGFGILLFVF